MVLVFAMWSRFRHCRERNPPWITLHREMEAGRPRPQKSTLGLFLATSPMMARYCAPLFIWRWSKPQRTASERTRVLPTGRPILARAVATGN